MNPWNWDDMWRELKCGAESQGGGFGGWFTQINMQANPVYSYLDGVYGFHQGVADGNWYAAGYSGANASMSAADTALIAVGGAGLASKVTSAFKKAPAVSNSSTALVKYDADFAVGQLTAAGRATASQLDEFGANQGWVRSQTPAGPIKYTDANGIVRITIKQGTSRAPGSSGPHVEIRNVDGVRIDPLGNPVTRKSPGNHTPIDWDL